MVFRSWFEGTAIKQDGHVLAVGGWRKVAEFMSEYPEVFAPVTVKKGSYFVRLPDEWSTSKPSLHVMPNFANVEDDPDFIYKLKKHGISFGEMHSGMYDGEPRVVPFGKEFGKRGLQRPRILGHGAYSTAYLLKSSRDGELQVHKRFNDDPFWKSRGVDKRDMSDVEEFIRLSKEHPDVFARYWRDPKSGRLMQEPVTVTGLTKSVENMSDFIDLVIRAEKSGLVDFNKTKNKDRFERIASMVKYAETYHEMYNALYEAYVETWWPDIIGLDAGPEHNVGYRKDGRMVFYDV